MERDVREPSRSTDLAAFRTLAQWAASRTGQVLVISTLARDGKLSSATASRYLGHSEALFLDPRVPPLRRNRSCRLIKSPRPCMTDNGLAASLADVDD